VSLEGIVGGLRDAPTDRAARLAAVLARTATILAQVWAEGQSEEEAFGEIVDRRRRGVLPDGVWNWIVAHTPLRNDFATSRSMFGGSVDERFAAVRNTDNQYWRGYAARTRSPQWLQVVCNELVEIVYAARGIPLRGGIAFDAAADFDDAGETPSLALRDQHEQDADGLPRTAAVAEAAENPTLSAPHGDSHRLFRPASLAELEVGDIYFVLGWAPLKRDTDASALVSPATPMAWRIAVPGGGAPVDVNPSEHSVTTEALHYGDTPPPPFGGAGLIARCGEKIVGRTREGTKYNYVLVWRHIGIYVGRQRGEAVTLETDNPAGMGRKNPIAWNFVFGRLHLAPSATAPDLSPFLSPERLLLPLDAPVTPL
jgi:hypothetical protein